MPPTYAPTSIAHQAAKAATGPDFIRFRMSICDLPMADILAARNSYNRREEIVHDGQTVDIYLGEERVSGGTLTSVPKAFLYGFCPDIGRFIEHVTELKDKENPEGPKTGRLS